MPHNEATPSPRTEGGKRAYGDLIRDRRFLLLEFRQLSGSTGYSVYALTILWLSYSISGNVLLPGIALGIETAVYTCTFIFGPMVDKVKNRRTIYVICYPAQALAAGALGFTYFEHILTVPMLLGIVAILAVLWDIVWAADTTSTRILFEQEDLFSISGLSTAIGGPINVIAYLTAGAIIIITGPGGGAIFYAILLSIAAMLSAFLSIPLPDSTGGASVMEKFREGWSYYKGKAGKALRELAALQSVFGFFIWAPGLLITLYSSTVLGSRLDTYTELYVSYMIGGVLAGIAVGLLNPRKRIGTYLIVGLFGTGLFLLSAQLVLFSVVLSVVAWFAVGSVIAVRTSVQYTYMMGAFPKEALARMNANSYLFTGVSSAAGALVFGVLSVKLQPDVVGLIAVLGYVLAGLLALLLPEIRKLSY